MDSEFRNEAVRRPHLPSDLEKKLRADIGSAIDRGDLGYEVDHDGLREQIIDSFTVHGPSGPYMVGLRESNDPDKAPLREQVARIGHDYWKVQAEMRKRQALQRESMELSVRTNISTRAQANLVYKDFDKASDYSYQAHKSKAKAVVGAWEGPQKKEERTTESAARQMDNDPGRQAAQRAHHERSELEAELKESYNRDELARQVEASKNQYAESDTILGRLTGKRARFQQELEDLNKRLHNVDLRISEQRDALERRIEERQPIYREETGSPDQGNELAAEFNQKTQPPSSGPDRSGPGRSM